MKNISKHSLAMLTGMLAALVMLITLGGSQARAECFVSPDKLVTAVTHSNTAALTGLAKSADSKAIPDDDNGGQSIIGLWHVHYIFSVPAMDQEAYQIFNAGGTEVHNPNTPTDGVCLGAWIQTGRTVRLTHRVWLYDPTGVFIGVGHLEANITLSDKGTKQIGTFTMQIFDLGGNAVTPAFPGTLSGERISPE